MIEDRQHFTDHVKLRDFMFSGKAFITIKSHRTGKHITYKIRRAPNAEGLWYVHTIDKDSVGKTGRYLGTVFEDRQEFRYTRNTKFAARHSDAYVGFAFLFSRLARGIPSQLTVYHEGKCGVCGRRLTDPASIANGIGPECSKKKLEHGFMYPNDLL